MGSAGKMVPHRSRQGVVGGHEFTSATHRGEVKSTMVICPSLNFFDRAMCRCKGRQAYPILRGVTC